MSQPPRPSRPVWLRRSIRWGSVILSLWLLFALVSWLSLPALIKKTAIEQTQEKIGRRLSIEQIHFNPFQLSITADNVVLYEEDQVTPAFSAQELLINASSTSLVRVSAIFDEVKLVAPKLHLVRLNADGFGHYNFSDVLDRVLALPKSEDKTYFSLANLNLQKGSIAFDDKVTGKTIAIEKLNIGIPQLSNLPRNIDTFVQPNLSMTVNGTPFSLKGRSKPFADSLDTVLAIDIDQLDIASYLPFSPVALPVAIQSASLSTRLDLHFSRNATQPQISMDGNIRLANLAVQDKNAAPLLKLDAIEAQIKQFDPIHLNGVIDEIKIDHPQLWADLNQRGELNWMQIGKDRSVAQSKTSAETAKDKLLLPAMTVNKFSLHDGLVNWTDAANASPRQTIQLDNINIVGTKLATPSNAPPGTISVSMRENGQGTIGLTGEVTPTTGNINAQIRLSAIQLSGYQHYLSRALNGRLSGELSGQTTLQSDGKNIRLSKLGLTLNNLQANVNTTATTPRNKPIISISNIALEDASLDMQSRRIDASALHIAGLKGDLQRSTNGSINLLELIATPPASPHPATVESAQTTMPNTPAWQARLGTFALTDGTVSYQDASVVPTQKLRVSSVDLKVNNLSSTLDQSSKISLQAKLNQVGKLIITGQSAPHLKSVALDLDAQNLPIAPFQSYFTDYLNVSLTSGTISAKGKLALTPPLGKQKLALSYDGGGNLGNLRLLDKLSGADFLKWRALNLQGIHAKIGEEPKIILDKVSLSDFYARAILSDQGQLNLQNILVHKDDSNSASPATTSASTGKPALIRIGQTVLQDGNINYTDNFVKPNYSANMTGMSGSIGSIASDQSTPAAIDLHGKIDNDAPLQISGTLNPLFKPMFLDIKASANGVQLPRLTPYSAKYAGYPITKGKLSMDVQYKIENDKLVAQNDIRIEQLSFGDHVDGPNVTKLPVMLAISLLKDRNGNIELNLPISGSLSDPQFSIGGVILRVIGNLIVKAVTSPFALINSLFGNGHSDELNTIEFAPGSAELTASIRNKLDTLGYALHQRPALKIDVMGRVDPATDMDGLRLDQLNQKILSLKRLDSAKKRNQSDTDAEQVTEDERNKYVGQIYDSSRFKKPRNVIGLAKTLPAEQMQEFILRTMQISEDDLRDLAQRRADLVRNYLQDQSIIAADRIYLIAPKLNAEGINDKSTGSRVELIMKP
ncbi:outer membrane protein OmpA-like peptidoglycan-associated protein [Herbaspirillum sp. Sphag1AN]|uniref:DUF748 domain-containing protein n=1 Tax=unclassified Herbaspirillum TaxID=2624150 RepID=UPI00160B8460|nr:MULTISPECIES: DUF748 domain-containing protein [unclassified Herbaspirillum]MBB3211359.1 outer membrane protein OmpA-like peptidoglycan-associated protein [Herbaspirillum sp. Sphag1AN]MBB3245374.1 outer membrane protein OmpA-like peptidoglycan-associated protein [Herbaspirillum sp. Sphag64]